MTFPMNCAARRIACALAALFVLHSGGVLAQMVTPALRACRAESDSARRLACYDSEMARIVESAQSAAATSAPKVEAAHPSPTERFGLPPPPTPAAETVPSKVTARVTSVSQKAQGRYLVSLDNGQVWLQTEDSLGFSPRPGGSVTIRRGLMGAYYMADDHYVVSVRRMH